MKRSSTRVMINQTAWLYVNQGSFDVVTESRTKEGAYKTTTITRIPLRLLLPFIEEGKKGSKRS